ncbi:MAG: lysophospholipid acyltransferase family protein [Alcanivoracaceae bacterium]|nr:lysophospholipid acyltransferase family protein [Alcanivoracaceae bacterium]
MIGILRSISAFVLPSLCGIILLVVCAPFGRRRALAITLPVVTTLGLRLAGITLRVDGDVAALQRRPAVFVINHQSGVDPLLVAALLKRDVVGIAKIELQRHLLLGPLLKLAGTLFVDRQRHAGPESLAPIIPALNDGYAVAIAAEGKRSHDGQLNPFKPGALWLAQHAKVPLIPIVLHNSHAILPAHQLIMRPGTVAITVLPAIAASESLDVESLQQRFQHCLKLGSADRADSAPR